MQIDDFDSTKILESGFRKKGNAEKRTEKPDDVCIYCGETVPCDSLRQHAAQHSRQEKFDLLLHADSVFSFNNKEKRYLNYVFSGYKDKEIARLMGIPEVSARRMRNLFNNRMRQARGLLLLDSLLEGKLKRRKKKKAEKINARIPSIDEQGIVQAFYPTKRALHEAGLLHVTSIIVVVKRDPETGEPAFLIVDKADKQVSTGNGLPAAMLDVLGGHVREEDFPPVRGEGDIGHAYTGQPLPFDTVLWNCAQRELSRELVSPSQDGASLSFWFENRYSGKHAEGINREISWVFLCRYQNGTLDKLNAPGEVRVKDDWIDSIGESVSHTYVGRFWKLSDIQNKVSEHPEQVNDGLKRVLEQLSKNPGLCDIL
jgi:hypothetical protein